MGCVYAVEHPVHTSVVVKLLHEDFRGDPAMVARMTEEARTAQQVSHRNVVRVLDRGETAAGVPFVAMERVRGVPLEALVQRDGPLSLARILSIAEQILGGLAAIHRASLVHGDMKSDNVLIEVGPAGDLVTIIDFGLARPTAKPEAHTTGQPVSGTPDYMAPEVIRGERPTTATDLYAVGVILYELLTGTTPFGGGEASTIFERHLRDEVPPPSLRCPDRPIPPAFERVILRALEKEPMMRYRDAEEFACDLARSVPPDFHDVAIRSDQPAFSTTAPTRAWSRPSAPAPCCPDHAARR